MKLAEPGSASVATMNPVQIHAEAGARVQHAINARKAAGANSVRRRLSIVFQRPIGGIAPRRSVIAVAFRSLPEPFPRPRIQGSNCQSPRAQRCWRAAATS